MSSQEDLKKILLSKPHAILGKKVITEEFIAHLNKLLKRYKLIKIKALKSAIHNNTIESIANELSERTQSRLVDLRGRTFILSIK